MRWLIATRPWSFTISLIPVVFANLLAASVLYNGRHDLTTGTGATQALLHGEPISWSWATCFLTLFGILFIHAAGNLTNTYFDFVSGNDQKDTASDRTLFDLGLSPLQVLLFCMGCYLASALIGCYVMLHWGALFVWYLLLGAVLTWSYTAQPLKLKARAMGDLVIFLCFGPLPVCGTYFLQTNFTLGALLHQQQELSWEEGSWGLWTSFASFMTNLWGSIPFWYSIPMGLLAVAILHVNNTRDILADKRANTTTLAQLLGLHNCYRYYLFLLLSSYAFVMGLSVYYCTWILDWGSRSADAAAAGHHAPLSWVGWLTLLALNLPLASLPTALSLIAAFKNTNGREPFLTERTAQFASQFGGLWCLALLFSFLLLKAASTTATTAI
ncbi:UbiA prenyltransferase domain-containing protein 1 [Balamuthia mandrillaris]